MVSSMTTLSTCLWFDGNGLEAAEFYTSLLPASQIDNVMAGPDGLPLMVNFTLMGASMQALNGGPHFTLNEAVSLVVPCDGQDEVDHYWNALTEGGEESRCGWLKDRFGLSWQIVPKQLGEILGDPDPERAGRATEAMMGMQKIDIAGLRAAADAESSVDTSKA